MVSNDQQEAFKDWLKQQGGYVNPKVSLFHQLPSGDRGVYATADINEGEQLLLVPVSCTLHLDVTDARGTQLAATCGSELAAFLTQQQAQPGEDSTQQQQQQPFSSFLASTLMLMSELSQGSSSSCHPYFDTLPEGTDCLINWTQQEQQLLAGTSLSDVTRTIQDIFEADIAPRLAARPDLFPPGCVTYESFRRAADLVQTRAFHMSADNWITGTSQESTDELYLIPAIDMLNHSTEPCLRNTSLALCHGDVEVVLEGGEVKSFTNFFSMKAEKAIPAGTQVLHTYGDLSDAQLLQTYGFIDTPPQPTQHQQQQQQQDDEQEEQEEARSDKDAAAAEPGAGGTQLTSNPHNYVVLQLDALLSAVKTVAAAAKVWPAKKAKQVLSKRLQHLASAGLLQREKPECSQLMVTASNTLPDQLLTIIQVLMMTEAEFKQLQQAEEEEQQEAAAAAKGSGAGSSKKGKAEGQQQKQNGSGDAAGAAAPQDVQLNLGREMLEDEFGELCGAALLQAVDQWSSRYPTDLKGSFALMAAAAAAGSRPWMAAAVVAGEQLLLQQLKKEALMIMLGAGQDEDEDEEGMEVELGSSDMEDDDDAEADADSDSDIEQELAAAAAAAGASKKRSRQQQAEQKQDKHKHKHKHKHGHEKDKAGKKHDHHHHHKKHKQPGKKDDRPHFGDMTGPAEADVWQSDDSDKVGYSSGSDDEGERHPVDGSDHHTYEVGAAGTVREAHGHMLGPDEAALIESDDSDKVGYADDAGATADSDGDDSAAAAAGAGGAAGRRNKRGSKAAVGGAAAGAGSKRPKRGLGFKG